MCREAPANCCNEAERLKRGDRLHNNLKNHRNRIVTIGSVLLALVRTTKHPASVMMLGVVSSNGEKMPPV